MIPFLPMAIGAGLGALTSKKPLKGALLGAGLGAAGGLLGGAGSAATGAAELAPGTMFNGAMLEGGMSVPAGSVAVNGAPLAGGMSVAPGASVTSAAPAAKTGGLLAEAQPWMNAASTGMHIANQFSPQQQPIQPPSVQQSGGGNQQLSALSQSLEQNKLNDAQMAQLKREAQQKLIGQIGGRYGLIG